MQQRAIKEKIKSTTSIKKITRTMEMISVTKMRKSMNISASYKSFINKGADIINVLSKDKSEIKNIFNNINNKSDRDLYIVIGGQKGLCGSFNVNIYRSLSKQLANNNKADFISINKYAEKICKRFININDNKLIYSFNKKLPTVSDYNIILKYITDSYKDSKYKNVYIVWTVFETVSKQFVDIKSLLPFAWENINNNININDNTASDTQYTIEPNIHKVLENAIVVILSGFLRYAYYDNNTSEHIARMNAMHNATSSASDMIKELKLYYNKSRQAAITQEISEIVSGAMSIGK